MFPLKHLWILLVSFTAGVFSQNSDSIARAINVASDDSNKVKQLLQLSVSSQGHDVPKAIAYAEQAIELSKKLNLPRLSVRAINHAGHLYDYVNYSERAILYHQQALAICEQNKLVKELGDTYNWLGGVFYNKHN